MGENELPSDLDERGWLFLDIERCTIYDFKQQTLIASFHDDGNLSESAALYDEDLSRVPVFLFTVVKNVVTLPGLRDDLSFVRSVFSLPSLHFIAEDALLEEVRNFTDLLVEMNRISYSEQGQTERGFLEFIPNFRRDSKLAGNAVDYSAIDLLRCCSSRAAQNLLQSVLCLEGGVQSSCNTCCDEIGQLSSDVTSGVCSVILGYLAATHVRGYGSVSGPLLQGVRESQRRLIDLSEFNEGMLWDDIGIVVGEEYRLLLNANLGYSITGERASSPEINN